MSGEGARGAAGASPVSGRFAAPAGANIFALLHLGDGDLDIFQHKLQLVGIEFLRALAETCALVFLQKQLETLDCLLRRRELALHMKTRRKFMRGALTFMRGARALDIERGAFGIEGRMLRREHGLLCVE